MTAQEEQQLAELKRLDPALGRMFELALHRATKHMDYAQTIEEMQDALHDAQRAHQHEEARHATS